MELKKGEVYGDYKMGPMLSKGTMSVTYGAIHTEARTRHALKLMFGADDQFLQRLKRGGEAQRSLVHDNLVRVTELAEIETVPTLVMEYVNGTSLDRWLEEPHPLAECMTVFRGMVQGVGHAHKAGIVHRNLKTEKILLDLSGAEPVAKVNDFILVKLENDGGGQLTQMGVSFGTPQYMAPEQFRDVSAVDERADLYALGCILYEMVCGRRAFEGTEIIEIYMAASAGEYPRPKELKPNLPHRIDEVLVSLLSVHIEKRPESCNKLLDILYGDGKLDGEIAAAAAADAAATPAGVKTVVPKVGKTTPIQPVDRALEPEEEGAVARRPSTPPPPPRAQPLAEEPASTGVSMLLVAGVVGSLALLLGLCIFAISLFLFAL